jgi:hypothetical protein
MAQDLKKYRAWCRPFMRYTIIRRPFLVVTGLVFLPIYVFVLGWSEGRREFADQWREAW